MPRNRTPGLSREITGGKRVCPLCWKPADSRDATNNGYHLECGKRASEIIMDLLHSKKGLAYAEWYRKRYPGRPVPGIDLQQQLGDERE